MRLGMMLRPDGLVAVEIRGTARGWRVGRILERHLDTDEHGGLPDLADALRGLRSSFGTGRVMADIALDCPLAHVRSLELPPLRRKSLERLVTRKPNRYFPVGTGEAFAAITRKRLRRHGPGARRPALHLVLAAGARGATVKGILAAAGAAGLQMDAVSPAPVAAVAGACRLERRLRRGTAGVVLLWRDRLDVLFLRRGRLALVRMLPRVGSPIEDRGDGGVKDTVDDGAIERGRGRGRGADHGIAQCQEPLTRATKDFAAAGDSARPQDHAATARAVRDILAEEATHGIEAEHIAVVGAGDGALSLARALEQEFSVRTLVSEPASPEGPNPARNRPRRTREPQARNVAPQEQSARASPQASHRAPLQVLVSVKLTAVPPPVLVALGSASIASDDLTLLPADLRAAVRHAGRRRTAVLLALAALFLAAAVGLRLFDLRREITAIASRRQSIRPAVAEAVRAREMLQRIDARLQVLQTVEAERSRWTSIFAELAARLPENAYVVGLHDDAAAFRLDVRARAAGAVLTALEASPRFAGVRLAGPVRPAARAAGGFAAFRVVVVPEPARAPGARSHSAERCSTEPRQAFPSRNRADSAGRCSTRSGRGLLAPSSPHPAGRSAAKPNPALPARSSRSGEHSSTKPSGDSAASGSASSGSPRSAERGGGLDSPAGTAIVLPPPAGFYRMAGPHDQDTAKRGRAESGVRRTFSRLGSPDPVFGTRAELDAIAAAPAELSAHSLGGAT